MLREYLRLSRMNIWREICEQSRAIRCQYPGYFLLFSFRTRGGFDRASRLLLMAPLHHSPRLLAIIIITACYIVISNVVSVVA